MYSFLRGYRGDVSRTWIKMGCMVFVFATLFLFSNSLVLAGDEETCDACEETPPLVQDYIDMMETFIELLPIDEKEDTGPKTGVHPGRVRNVSANAVASAEKNIIPPYIPLESSVFIDIDMTTHGKSLQRDYEKVMEISDKIAERVIDMVDAGHHKTIVPHAVWEKVNKQLKKIGFFTLRKDTNGKYMLENDKMDYAVLANFIRRLQKFYEESYRQNRRRKYLKNIGKGVERTNQKSREDAINELIKQRASIFVQEVGFFLKSFLGKPNKDTNELIDFIQYLDPDRVPYILYVWSVHDNYRCTVGLATNMCNKKWQKTRKNLSYLKKKTGTDARNAWKTFVDAWGRLRATFGIGSKEDKIATKQRQNALLHTYRGRDVSEQKWRQHFNKTYEVRGSPMSVGGLVSAMKESWKLGGSIGKGTKKGKSGSTLSKKLSDQPIPERSFDLHKTETIDAKKAVLEALSDDIEERKKFQQLYLKNQERTYERQANISQMKNAFQDVLRLQSKLEQDNAFIDVRRVTQQFPALSAIVYKNIDIIGNKGDDGKLYNSMGQVCDKQCKNLSGKKKCFADK